MLTLAYELNHKVYTKLYTVDATLESVYCLFLLIHRTSTKMETETERQRERNPDRHPDRHPDRQGQGGNHRVIVWLKCHSIVLCHLMRKGGGLNSPLQLDSLLQHSNAPSKSFPLSIATQTTRYMHLPCCTADTTHSSKSLTGTVSQTLQECTEE